MAKTVMTHLDFVRAKAEHERGTRMVSGLGAFIEGASSMQSWKKETERRDYRRVGRAASPEKKQLSGPTSPNKGAAKSAPRPTLSSVPPDTLARVTSTTVSLRASAPTSSDSTSSATSQSEPATPPESAGAQPQSRMSRQSTENLRDLQDQLLPPNLRDTFQRAADLLREAVNVDGVAYLDSSPNTYGGLVDVHDGSDQSSDAPTTATEATGTESEGKKYGTNHSDKACSVLASSHTSEDRYNHRGELPRNIQATTITERFLRSLLRRNPFGKIWNFSEEGTASSDDSASDSGGGGRRDGAGLPLMASSDGDQSDASNKRRTARRRRGRIDDGREIQRLFPGVRSLALCGMWDQNRNRWYSVCAIWTYSPLRLFSQELDLNYMSAFCDVVMAELYRLEAQNSSRAKSDFISSISHELRSPLHGILGSVECLQEETSADSYNSDLISQIEVCGRTLMDVVEHLLDYSKINHQTKSKQPSDAPGSGKKRSKLDEAKKSQLGGLMSFDSDVGLAQMTEEVVETAVYSFCCARPKNQILERDVAVILDVASAIDWRCRIPLGAWKRICINLVSNAMKYTSHGFIHVSLKAQPIQGKRRKFNAVLTVQDSGRGMSSSFLSDHLFRAFSQEDNLMEGTGLGMSLVAKIVKVMGGRIDVSSEKDVGTTFTVTIPVDVGRSKVDRTALQGVSGATVAILGFEDEQVDAASRQQTASHATARSKLLKSLQNNCEQLGVHTVRPADGDDEPAADVCLLLEQDLSTYAQQKQLGVDSMERSGLDKPLIIICKNAISVRQLRSAASGFTTRRVELVAQPVGAERLGKAIRHCLGDAASLAHNDAHATQGAVSSVASQPGQKDLHLPFRAIEHAPSGLRYDGTRDRPVSTKVADPPTPDEETPTPGLSRTSTDKLPTPPEDYLSSRSKSLGDAPLSPQAVDTVTAPKPSVQVSTKSAPASGMSLLLVDDNQINLQLLVTYSKKQRHRWITATNGMQAVEAYKAACGAESPTTAFHATPGSFTRKHSIDTSLEQSEKPQVILMDISMPVMNGFEATRLIRAFEQQHGVQPAYIIALTGLGSASAQQEAFSSGVDLYLTKPVRLKELTSMLASIRASEARKSDPT